MTIASVPTLVEILRQYQLLQPAQMEKLTRKLQYRHADPRSLAKDLVRRGWLTPQQVNQLFQAAAVPILPVAPGPPPRMSYSERKAAGERRMLMFTFISLLVLMIVGGAFALIVWRQRTGTDARDAEARLRALEDQAASELQPLVDRFRDPDAEEEQLRFQLLAFRQRYAEVPQAVKASEMLSQLPSPLDSLSRTALGTNSAEELFPGLPQEVVGIFGQRRYRHWGEARGLVLSPDSSMVATNGEDGVRLWDRRTGQEIAFLPAGNVVSVAYVGDGKTLATGATDGTVSLWEATTGKKVATFQGPLQQLSALAITRDGQSAASGTPQGAVKLWELNTGKEKASIPQAHKGAVTCMTFSPDGGMLVTGGADTGIRVWNGTSGQAITSYGTHSAALRSLVFSADGKFLASGGDDSDVHILDMAQGQAVGKPLEGHSLAVTALAFSRDGKSLVTGSADRSIRVWEIGKETPTAILEGHAGTIWGVALVSEGQGVVSASADGTVRAWNVAEKKEESVFRGHVGSVTSVTFLDDQGIASGSTDRTVKLWNVTTGEERFTLAGHTATVSAVAYSPLLKMVASGSYDTTIKLWDAPTGNKVGDLTGHIGPIMSLAFSLDGNSLAAACTTANNQAGEIKLWNTATRTERPFTNTHEHVVSSVAFAPDGRTLASGSWDWTIRLWDPFLGKEKAAMRDDVAIDKIAVSPDGKSVAAANQNNIIRIWDASGMKVRVALPAQPDYITALAYAPSGKFLVSAHHDGQLATWDATSGAKIQEWKMPGAVNSIAFASDSRHIATGNGNSTIYVMRVAEMQKRKK